MGLPTRRSRSLRCNYICFLVKLSYFIIHSLYRIAFSLSEKLLKCHPAKNHCFVFMICQIKRYPLRRFSLNTQKNCQIKRYFVRLNASNFCSVAFTLTNLRLLCQVTKELICALFGGMMLFVDD